MKLPPGIEAEPRKRGTVYRVRYRDAGGQRRSKTFDRADDAVAFQSAIRLRARMGTLAELDAGREPLQDFVAEWWSDWATGNLARATLRKYASVWNVHALPRLGHVPLRDLSPQMVERFAADLLADGIGDEAVRTTLVFLQSVYKRAVIWERVLRNPVQHVKKPGGKRQRAIEVVVPERVEAIRSRMIANDQLGSATLVSVLAYAGLRPEEALALRWRHMLDEALWVEDKNVGGEVQRGAKVVGKPPRSVDLLAPLAADLRTWRTETGSDDDELIFARRNSAPWADHDYRNWRRRTYNTAARAVGVANPRPYDLRHSFASLLLHEGRLSVIEVAAQLGHNPATLLSTYAHVIADLKGKPRTSAVASITLARATIHGRTR